MHQPLHAAHGALPKYTSTTPAVMGPVMELKLVFRHCPHTPTSRTPRTSRTGPSVELVVRKMHHQCIHLLTVAKLMRTHHNYGRAPHHLLQLGLWIISSLTTYVLALDLKTRPYADVNGMRHLTHAACGH
jgi:hypothetical protein